jgi:hypothetical protein
MVWFGYRNVEIPSDQQIARRRIHKAIVCHSNNYKFEYSEVRHNKEADEKKRALEESNKARDEAESLVEYKYITEEWSLLNPSRKYTRTDFRGFEFSKDQAEGAPSAYDWQFRKRVT